MEYYLESEARTLECGMAFARQVSPGECVFLEGDLGAGKTTFVRGILRGLGYTDLVKSPSYTLVESYLLDRLEFFHFDLYRIEKAAELIEMGFADYFRPDTIICIEWASQAQSLLPNLLPKIPAWDCHIRLALPGRYLTMTASCDLMRRDP